MLKIAKIKQIDGFALRLILTNGAVIERDLSRYVKESKGVLRRLSSPKFFARARVSYGTVEWPDDVDISPEALIWGGPPRSGRLRRKATLIEGGKFKKNP